MFNYFQVIFRDIWEDIFPFLKVHYNPLFRHISLKLIIGNQKFPPLQCQFSDWVIHNHTLFVREETCGPIYFKSHNTQLIMEFSIGFCPIFQHNIFFSNYTVFCPLECQIIKSLLINTIKSECDLQAITFSTWLTSTNILNCMDLPKISGTLGGIRSTESWYN